MDLNDFIDRWSARRGGAERANYQMFLTELCEALELPRPDPASDDNRSNDYVFERGVKRRESEGVASTTRIDLYKRGCFILEAKQSRASQRDDGGAQPSFFKPEDGASLASAEGKWDTLMRNARRQAEDYVFRLPPDHPAPPFILVCDVGYVFEVYADFSGSGRAYTHFPDRKGFRIKLEDLRNPDIAARLRTIWTDPHALDPSKKSAQVTRQIAERLAAVSRRLERNHPAEEVAQFLMRCIFTMFAEDVDLLPRGEFTRLLQECLDGPDSFAPLLRDLWKRMDDPDYDNRFFSGFKAHLRHFNGNLFRDARAFPMTREEIGELLAAAGHDWRYVEPAIFGTLVEQALDPAERRQLGAHYTPRSYVERLVEVTVMEPLRADWNAAQLKAGDAKERGDLKEAVAAVRAFHHALCTTRVLDPACGTGNFLYVSLELMKRLEGEVLEALAELGETETMGLEEVDPHQFLGIELNVRAAAIAELVLWIGYLQQHYRNRSEHPAEPILKAFGNIQQKDAVLTWDGYPELQFEMRDGVAVQVFPNARRPAWPEAEFIVGNPPFIGGANLRSRMPPGYAEALWSAHPHMNESADFVMYWWDRAAEMIARPVKLARAGTVRAGDRLVGYPPRRFGLVTTNSISQVFQRRVMERHLNAKAPVSIIFAVPDHPWTKATKDSAAVRIAMTVAQAGSVDGELLTITREDNPRSDEPVVDGVRTYGRINPDLSIGAQSTAAVELLGNHGICHKGMQLNGQGFVLSEAEKDYLIETDGSGARAIIRPYINGKDLTQTDQRRYVIDTYGLGDVELRASAPSTYSRLLELVKPERDAGREPSRKRFWWLHGRTHETQRSALAGLPRYIGTTRTAKHRTFTFVPSATIAESKVVVVASQDAALLGILSSQSHLVWALKTGGFLEDRPTYQHVDCFNKFPFPDPSDATRQRLRALGEELDATRKTVQAQHPDLTLTGLYNVLEKVRAGTELTPAEADVKARGRVLILRDLHDQIDRATADAYGWRHDLTDEEILEKLVALNAERAKEEAAGHVRWLRPDYQIPRFAKGAASAKTGELDLGAQVVAIDKGLPAFPKDKGEQVMAIRAVLQAANRPMDAAAVSRAFKGGGKKIEQRVVQALRTLVRYAEIIPLPDGTYAARRAA
ncbi:class I SAM-dependent DNA methyltransferase [Brevundimonas sp.]|uniref:class I SAM-dependent DNA methyltransferase n=2 Tax=Brevundimonas sp. TaxID=1871086 RepID=UPI00391CFDA1